MDSTKAGGENTLQKVMNSPGQQRMSMSLLGLGGK